MTTASEILYEQAYTELTLALSLLSKASQRITIDSVITSMISIAKGLEVILREMDFVKKKRKRSGTVVYKQTRDTGQKSMLLQT